MRPGAPRGDLGIGADLDSCVQCGLCLPHCPTWRVSGDEALSPRGRIALMRAVERRGAPLSADVVASLDTCIGCRGCEAACPSGVPFGHMIEKARSSLAAAGVSTPRWQRAALGALGHPRLVRAASRAAAVAQRAGAAPRRAGLPARLPLRSAPLRATGADVALFTGCVMDAWQRDVHRDVVSVLGAAGYGVTPTGDSAPCCGALHLHAGLTAAASALARKVVAGVPAGMPILVDSAGCGAALEDYGRLLDTPDASELAGRVFDVAEWLAPRMERLPAVAPLPIRVAVSDPCHLRHVQKAHMPTRVLLGPFVEELVELDDEGLCCGAGGAYSLLQPGLAGKVGARKMESIGRARVDAVATANPGCAIHLAGLGAPTVHPLTLVARAIAAGGAGEGS